jgi:hypothetical protein
MRTMILSACAILALVTPSAAQTSQFAGKMECDKPDPNHTMSVDDNAKHVLSLGATKCTWTDGTLGGERLKDEKDSFTSDASGGSSNDRGYGVGTLANGDKYFVHFKGESKLQGENPISSECTWKFTGGTGKLSGLTGKGTCKGTFKPDGKANWEIKGQYAIGAEGAAAAKKKDK